MAEEETALGGGDRYSACRRDGGSIGVVGAVRNEAGPSQAAGRG